MGREFMGMNEAVFSRNARRLGGRGWGEMKKYSEI